MPELSETESKDPAQTKLSPALRGWEWFDEVTGVSKMLHPLLYHPVPRARKSAWLYVLGSATLFAFLVQIVTGIALSSLYVPSSAHAYQSLLFISSTHWGSLVRAIHYWGATAMVGLIGAHAIRVYLMGSYKYPRQVNWITGVILLFLTVGMAFSGQLLRFDQTGLWTAFVASQQAARTPIIGNWLAHFVLGGNNVAGNMVSRFFMLHVFIIPAIIFIVLGFHLYLVVHNGISDAPAVGRKVDPKTYRAWYKELLARDGEPFWPNAAWRDAVFGFIVVCVIVACAVLWGPVKLGGPPNPAVMASVPPKPDWYLLWDYALLASLPGWTESYMILLGPLLFILALLWLPFAGGRGERHPRRRPWAVVIVVAILSIIIVFGRRGVTAPWSPRFEAPPLPASVVGTTTGPIARGAQLFYSKGCEFCHTIDGYGGIRGPNLSGAGDTMPAGEMKTRILDGGGYMPAYSGNMSPQDLSDLIAFLSSRHLVAQPGGTPQTINVEPSADAAPAAPAKP